MSRYYASERAYELANAVTAMAARYGTSQHYAGLAFDTATRQGSLFGKPWQHWQSAANRQFRALQRLTAALRDVDVQQTPTPTETGASA